MKITKRGFICLAACMLAASLFARPHHHKPLPPNAKWCLKCDGDGYYRTWYTGYFGTRPCSFCKGRGYIVPPPPPPPPHVHKGGIHHGGPAVAPRPAPMPAPKPAPRPVPPPKAGPRR